MNRLSGKENPPHVTRCEPTSETIDSGKSTPVFAVTVIVVGICLAVIGIFFMSCGLFHVKNVGEALLAFETFLFS